MDKLPDTECTDPAPPPPIEGPQPQLTATSDDAFEQYHRVADTIGGVPNVRLSDNLLQIAMIALGTITGGVLGWVFIPPSSWGGVLIGAVIGLIGSTLLSGAVLMVLSWVQAAKHRGRG
ncbi:MAG: hypothetical protein KAS72_15465 [Phycisphaerales bacterium]|nr:hypothetical protein [Phycisphaerales bacterium]